MADKLAMPTLRFLRSLVELSAHEDLEVLVGGAISIIERDLETRGCVEVWTTPTDKLIRGEPCTAIDAHCTWIGSRYTIGAIRLRNAPRVPLDVELLACQLAPLVERLLEREASRPRTIREDIDRLYARRIREALVRCDWNMSAVAKELAVSRSRVAEVARRWRRRSGSRRR